METPAMGWGQELVLEMGMAAAVGGHNNNCRL
jgi:hypothetical protein